MADLTKAKEVVKETLLGSELVEDVQLSALSKATFDKNARKEPESDEPYMGEEEFINAIAPKGEDYVRPPTKYCTTTMKPLTNSAFLYIAQDQARTICDLIQSRRSKGHWQS